MLKQKDEIAGKMLKYNLIFLSSGLALIVFHSFTWIVSVNGFFFSEAEFKYIHTCARGGWSFPSMLCTMCLPPVNCLCVVYVSTMLPVVTDVNDPSVYGSCWHVCVCWCHWLSGSHDYWCPACFREVNTVKKYKFKGYSTVFNKHLLIATAVLRLCWWSLNINPMSNT